MKPVEFHPQAESELAESVNFYNERRLGLGNEFFAIVKMTCRQIQNNPLIRPLRRDGPRKVKLPRFPHSIIYRDKADVIEIVAVAHGARRPNYWQQRL